MRVACLGLPLAALLLADDGHDVVIAWSPRKVALGNRRARRRFGERFAVVGRVDEARGLRAIEAAKPDLLVSWFFTKRIPTSWTAACPRGAFGVHPSLLPRHRGPDPTFWAIERGDAATGVTAHRLLEEYDTGALLGHRSLAIDPSWNAWTLAKRLDRPSLALLRDTVRRFAAGDVAETPQDEGAVTLAPAPTGGLLELSPTMTVEAFLRRVRALAPWPGALLQIGDEEVVVTEARAAPAPRALEPGQAAISRGTAVLRVADGGVALLRGRVVRDDGEEEADLPRLVARVAG